MATKQDERDVKAFEQRRRKAARLLARGVKQADVARQLNVSRQSISTWAKSLEADPQAWRSKPTGYPAALDQAQRKWLCALMRRGAQAYGFTNDVWTLSRVAKVIRQEFGIAYGRTNVWLLLKALGFSCQRPAARATQRDEQAIWTWQHERWPMIKKKPAARGEPSSSLTKPG
jgi:transposase